VPEGDTVHLAARRLNGALAGRELLAGSELRVPAFATSYLPGRRVGSVEARGKHILVHLDDDLILHTHFKMEGSWHLYRSGSRWRGPAFEVRAVLVTDEWNAVGYRLAVVELLTSRDAASALEHLGPDVLGPDWDEAEAIRRMRDKSHIPIQEALLDQSVMAGPGNVYKCEICFLAGVHPLSLVRDVDVSAIVALTKRVMEANRATGSQVTTGDPRSGRSHWVYGRGGQPCRRCRSRIQRAEHDWKSTRRVTYWCPSCQPSARDHDHSGAAKQNAGARSTASGDDRK
jgi:endonuclease VIII